MVGTMRVLEVNKIAHCIFILYSEMYRGKKTMRVGWLVTDHLSNRGLKL
jgi:hypothetical protein